MEEQIFQQIIQLCSDRLRFPKVFFIVLQHCKLSNVCLMAYDSHMIVM